MKDLSPRLIEKFSRVKLLAMNVDGVLTDGGVYVLENGWEFRRFDIKDGLGIKRLLENNVEIVVISSGNSKTSSFRMNKLGVNNVLNGVVNKLTCLQDICTNREINFENVCFIGDDLVDLEVLQKVGLACCPQDAAEEIVKIASYISTKKGGNGVVRDVCDLIIRWKR